MNTLRAFSFLVTAALLSMGASCGSLGLTPGNAIFTTPQDVTLEANINSLRINEVLTVEFRRNDVSVCSAPQAPYQCVWSITAADNGNHVWTALAHTQSGEVLEGDTVTLAVRIEEAEVDPDPLEPPDSGLVGFLPGVGNVRDVVVDGGQAFVASADYGLTTLELFGADSPQIATSAQTPFSGVLAAVAGNLAVVAGRTPEGLATLRVLDLNATPTAVLGELETGFPQGDPSGFQEIALDGARALAVATVGIDGVLVIDLSDPAAPAVIGSYRTPWTAYGLVLQGSLAYVAVGLHGLQILDLSDPTLPALVSTTSLAGVARDVSIVGDIAYVSIAGGGLKVVDVSNPAAPNQVGFAGTNFLATHVAAEGSWAVVRGTDNIGGLAVPALEVFDLSDPIRPRSRAVMPVAEVADAAIVGDFAYVPDGREGLKIFDLRLLSTFVAVVDDLQAEVIAEGNGLTVIGARNIDTGKAHLLTADSSNPSNPRLLGELKMDFSQGGPFGFQEIVVDTERGLAVATAGIDGVLVVDLSDPENPFMAGRYSTAGTARGLVLDGNVAYVADTASDLLILSLADPSHPVLIGSKSLTGSASDLSVVGNLAYVSISGGGLKVVDVSDLGAPRLVGLGFTEIGGTHVAANGSWLVVRSNTSDGPALEVFDLSNPVSPQSRGTLPLADVADVTLVGDIAYVPDGVEGLKIFRLGGSGVASLLTSQDSVGAVAGASVSSDGRLVRVSDRAATLAIIATPNQ